jgi:hypothetical protein
MALPDRSPIPLVAANSHKPAFLVKFPQDVWQQVVAAQPGTIQVSHDDAKLVSHLPDRGQSLTIQSLVLPDRTLALDAQTLNPTEIYEVSSSLNPIGLASTRLSVPYALAPAVRAPEKARANGTSKKEAKGSTAITASDSVSKLRQQAAVPLARSQSNPITQITQPAGTPIVPLKTRVVQHLALGPASVEEIVGRVGGAEADVMRVVKVVSPDCLAKPSDS